MNSKKKYSRSHIGKVFTTNEGYKCKVIDGGSKRNYVTIKIDDWVIEAAMGNIKKGILKYPYNKSVHNVGYFGEGKYSPVSDRLAYQKWYGMIERCYSEEHRVKNPTYADCIVSEEWHNFQVFAEWHERYYPRDGLKYELDKDIKVKGNKIYSSCTCMFVPRRLNIFMSNIYINNTSGCTGVSWHRERKRWCAEISINGKSKWLGYFKCIKTASRVYKEARLSQAESLKMYYSFDYSKSIIDNIR